MTESEWLVTRHSGRAYDLVNHDRTCLILAAGLSQRASVLYAQQVPDTESRAQTLTESNTARAQQQCPNFFQIAMSYQSGRGFAVSLTVVWVSAAVLFTEVSVHHSNMTARQALREPARSASCWHSPLLNEPGSAILDMLMAHAFAHGNRTT